MIEAELHGKVPPGLQDNEDLLTSTVFGLLQYIPPNIFWSAVLQQAKSCDNKNFIDRCNDLGIDITGYENLDIYFWPVHNELGEPDLLLFFSSKDQSPLCFIIEAKLGATKSGRGEQDQLNRYLATLSDSKWLSKVTGFRGLLALPGLIYLTPSVAWLELRDSIEHAPEHLAAESSLFLLQWQDILEVSRQVLPYTDEPQKAMLNKIAVFLEHRGLDYFHGFTHLTLEDDIASRVQFYSFVEAEFSGFIEMPIETLLPVEVHFYTSEQTKTFYGFTVENFEQISARETIFYGGNQ